MSQLEKTVVDALRSWDAKADSNAHLKLKFGLTPTMSTLVKVWLWGTPACHALFTETPAHPDSHTTAVSNITAATTAFFCCR